MTARPLVLFAAALALPALLACATLRPPDSGGAMWPPILTRPDNPTTPAKVALGRLLFFDPVLSNDNRTSCAHCHHPDLGFSDGLARARGYGGEGAGSRRVDGVELARHTPTLWNVAFYRRQFWDGRARDLEDQAQFPISDLDEMKQDPQTLVAELQAIPEYHSLFDQAFGRPGGRDGSAITFPNVLNALAAFERTLVSRHSRYDRYAAGDSAALTPSEKRGLALFLSPRTRCSECHTPPLFSNLGMRCTGVPDVAGRAPDPHRFGAQEGCGGGPNSAYKVPSLRNVALHPPYMHNGSLASLNAVLDFYTRGGGRGRGLTLPNQDPRIRPFTLTPQERADLIAFLRALNDTSAMPAIPREAPSGLPVVEHMR